MRYYLNLSIAAIIYSRPGYAMPFHPLQITVNCSQSSGCTFTGHDISLDVTVTNVGDTTAQLPLDFYLAQGPIITIKSERTGRKTNIRRYLAPPDLRNQTSSIEPGGRFGFVAKIPAHVITGFNEWETRLQAEVTFATQITGPDGKPIHFSVSGTAYIDVPKSESRLLP